MKTICTSANELLHVPNVHVSVFIIDAVLRSPIPIAVVHDLNFPACREGLRDHCRCPFQMQSLQIPNSEEPVAADDAADDETCTTGMKIPLQYQVRVRERVNGGGNLQYCKAAPRARGPRDQSRSFFTATQRLASPAQ